MLASNVRMPQHALAQISGLLASDANTATSSSSSACSSSSSSTSSSTSFAAIPTPSPQLRYNKKRKVKPQTNASPAFVGAPVVEAVEPDEPANAGLRPEYFCPIQSCVRHRKGWKTMESMLTHVENTHVEASVPIPGTFLTEFDRWECTSCRTHNSYPCLQEMLPAHRGTSRPYYAS